MFVISCEHEDRAYGNLQGKDMWRFLKMLMCPACRLYWNGKEFRSWKVFDADSER